MRNIYDLGLDDLRSELSAIDEEIASLETFYTSKHRLDAVASQIALQALHQRRTEVGRAVQAFEKVTYKNIATFGVMKRV